MIRYLEPLGSRVTTTQIELWARLLTYTQAKLRVKVLSPDGEVTCGIAQEVVSLRSRDQPETWTPDCRLRLRAVRADTDIFLPLYAIANVYIDEA